MDLKTDPERRSLPDDEKSVTGILVRAQDESGEWVNADIADLDKPSLLRWVRSRGGDNKWAEATVCILLGHEYVPETDDEVR